jgi:ribosome recycling factor
MSATHKQGEEFQKLTEEASIQEECQRLREFLQRGMEKIQKLVQELHIKRDEPHREKEEIQELVEEINIKKEEIMKIAEEANRLLREFQETGVVKSS